MFLLVCILVKETLEIVNVTWLLGIWLCHKKRNALLLNLNSIFQITNLCIRYGHWWKLSIKINNFMFYDREMDVLIKLFSRNWKLKMHSFRVNTSWVDHYHWLDSVLSWWSHSKCQSLFKESLFELFDHVPMYLLALQSICLPRQATSDSCETRVSCSLWKAINIFFLLQDT